LVRRGLTVGAAGLLLGLSIAEPFHGAAPSIGLELQTAGDAGPVRIELPQRRVSLAPITLADLGLQPEATLGSDSRRAVRGGGGMLTAAGALRVPAVNTRVRRTLPGVWRA